MATLAPGTNGLSSDISTPSRWRRNRSSANLLGQVAQPAANSPTHSTTKPPPKLERTASKMSLFNLFSRPKVEKARGRGYEVGLAVPMPPPDEQQSTVAPISTPKSSLRVNPLPSTQQAQRSRASQMFRPMSMRPTSMIGDSVSWDPPPLFQAYPQSIKHATLQSCVFSPDSLLRTQSQKKQYDMMRDRVDSHRDLPSALENVPEMRKLEKTHKRLVSNSVMNPAAPQLTDKLYVLVTSGYVLQYAGDGPFDRPPEKVLKLGKDSAAFACDAIPGKHWVLQISSSASQDGTVAAPKSSIMSRFRSQNSPANRAAASLLLVLDSAEEMDSWMTIVRKEIDRLGGMGKKEEAIRESSSIDESSEKVSSETPPLSHRYLIKRDPNRMSKAPVDSPLQSQYSESPKIVTSEWEADRTERSSSIADSSSLHSSKNSNNRKSIEVASIATTAVSHDQFQLEQLREKSRYSYVSTATSVSGPGTRNTSRNSSPSPTSPLKEQFSPADAEPLRSATSLRSFHMIPGNTTTNRRRSMQPLPVTNEDTPLSADAIPITPQRHSFYGPVSPPVRPETKQTVPALSPATTTATATATAAPAPASVPTPVTVPAPAPTSTSTSQLAPLLCGHTRNDRFSAQPPSRYGMRSSSAPPVRHSTISPPPRDPAPHPNRTQSTFGNTGLSPHGANRRLSQSPKPFLRPFPVRPQAQHAIQSTNQTTLVAPKRLSSLGPPPPTSGNRSFTAPARQSATMSANRTSQNDALKSGQTSQPLRRPNSVQIRSNPAPFLSSSRPVVGPVRAIHSTPSFVPGNRVSNTPRIQIHQATSVPALREHAQQQTLAQQPSPTRATQQPPAIMPRRSMPVIAMAPPAPPPNMPLPPPPPPPNMALPPPPPPTTALPPLPPTMPLPALPLPSPPPTTPLPLLPTATPHAVAV